MPTALTVDLQSPSWLKMIILIASFAVLEFFVCFEDNSTQRQVPKQGPQDTRCYILGYFPWYDDRIIDCCFWLSFSRDEMASDKRKTAI